MIVYTAIILTAMLGFCGLAIDVSRMQLRTLQLQAAADAGAMSAATEVQRLTATSWNGVNTASSWKTIATTDVLMSESLNGIPSAPPDLPTLGATSGPYTGDQSAVEVVVRQNVATSLLGILGSNTSSMTLGVRAVAVIPPCVYTFSNPAVNNGFSNNNWGMQLASMGFKSNCPTYAATGIFVDGFANICCSQEKNNGGAAASNLSGSAWPAMKYNAPVLTDPLAYITAPAFSACKYTNKVYTTVTTIQPGTYCGGITINNTTVTFSPGLYIITGGATIKNSTIQGNGVTLYFTKGGGSLFGTFQLLNNSKMNINAPTSAAGGGITGVVIFGDRNWVGGNEDFSFMFSAYRCDGIIYTTHTGIYDWITDMSGPNYFNVVSANWYTYLSNVTTTANYNSLPSGNPLHTTVSLVQ